MSGSHGAETIKSWIEDLVRLARSGAELKTSGGAEPNRDYAYLEYHVSDDRHSALVFTLDDRDGRPTVKAVRVDGSAEEVREGVDRLTHPGR